MRKTMKRSLTAAALALFAGIGLALAPSATADPPGTVVAFNWVGSGGGATTLDVIADADSAGKICKIFCQGSMQASTILEMGSNLFVVPTDPNGYGMNGPQLAVTWTDEGEDM